MHTLFYEFLNDDELLRISKTIREMEKYTSGEIVVSIKERRSLLQKHKSVKQLAQKEFQRIGMKKTRDKTGILLFIILEAREFYVLADDGIHSIVGDSAWEGIKDLLLQYFKDGDFCHGIVAAVREMGKILSPHFPIKPDDTNEISNRVIVRP